jgi:hypothetical protein
MAIQQASMARGGASSISRAPRPSSLADVLDLILDKGLVIDAYVRVSVIGIEILTIDLRVVVASVDTYLRFAEAVNRLDLAQTGDNMTLQDLQRGGAESVGEGKARGALEKAKDRVTPGDGEEGEDEGAGKKVKQAAKRAAGRSEERGGGDGGGGRGRSAKDGQDDASGDDDDDGGGGLRGVVSKVAERAKWS